MPGIVGLITRMPRQAAEERLSRMMGCIRHESFYQTGCYIDEALGVYVGWSSIQGTLSSRMPVQNVTGDVTMIFSGEEVAATSAEDRVGRRVTETVGTGLARVSAEDSAFPRTLNGRFHGLLLDRGRGIVKLFIDRYGMHRLYYHEEDGAFLFAAEAKSILAVCPKLRRIDARGLGEFVSCGCVLENRTLFAGIQVLPAGSLWTFRSAALADRDQYFTPSEWEEQEPLTFEAYYREIRDVFAGVLPRYLASEQRIGMSLTGGFDTRAVMAWQRKASGELPCYTYGGMFRECEDVRIAKRVAGVCEQPHHVIPVGQQFLSRFREYARRSIYLTDGCVDLLRCPDLYVSERAREIAPIRLTGLYGDEILRHMRAFKPGKGDPSVFAPEVLKAVREARETYGQVVGVHPLTFAAFRQAPWHHYGILALEQTQLTVRTPFLDNDLVRTVYRSPKLAVANNDIRLRLIADGNPALARIRTDRGFGGEMGQVSSFLVRNFLEFTFKSEYAYDYGMPQWLARADHALSPFRLERLFLGRHKIFHFRIWYRDALAASVREVLLDSSALSRPYLDRRAAENAVRGHLAGNRNYTVQLHQLMTLELLHQCLIDNPGTIPG